MKYLICIAIIHILYSCLSTKVYGEELLGNVYTKEGKCEKWTSFYINGLRIEEVREDSLYIRLQLGKEIFYPISLKRSNNDGFISVEPVSFYSNRKTYKSFIKFKFSKNNYSKIFLTFQDSLIVERKLQYIYTHKSYINSAKIRNIYYSEDGFNLCE